MKEHPILFSDAMVQAILEGRKTQTRRVVKCGVEEICEHCGEPYGVCDRGKCIRRPCKRCPYGVPGDRLWVRETWGKSTDRRGSGVVRYRADDSAMFALAEDGGEGDWCGITGKADPSQCQPVTRWRSSIHMPRWASRLTLEVVSIRVERLQEISDEDAIAEGTEPYPVVAHIVGPPSVWKKRYAALWDSINGVGAWDINPWVWVVEFKMMERA